ncbi:MAG TPA: Calx-beta domain-containing protein, partial [Blastocatellia bacterium]|nr:Calx-beta domain-containing protein [Blastocatellia bacterium]
MMKDTESSATLSSRQREQGPTGYQKSLPRFAILITVVGVLVVLSIRTASAHINSLLPNQWTAGGPAFTLRMLGTDIDQSDTGRVLFNGTRVAATLVMAGTPGELQATIPANLITSPGVVRVELEGFPPAADFTINPPPTITTGFQLPDAVPGQAYSQRLQVSGGTAPFTWTSTLPAGYGLSLSPDGLISGTAIATETAFEFQATVTDAATVRAVRNFGIRIRYPCASEAPCLFIEDTQVTEGDTGPVAAVFNVRLSRPSAVPVTVVATTQDFTATAPNDYTARTGPLTINAGATLTTIAVPVNGDTVYEAHEQFYLNLTNPVNATIARAQGTCTISDNDPG